MSLHECVQFYSSSSVPKFNYQEVEPTDNVSWFECSDENEESIFQCGNENEQKFFQVGDRVTLRGLKMDELNGRSGTITKFMAHEGRWEVKVDGYSCAVKLITEHLSFEVPIRAGDRVVLRGLKTKGMNGKKGTAKKFIAGQGRWEVEMDDSDCTLKIVQHKIRHEDRVQIGDRVTLQNLSEGGMNGRSGRVTHYNDIEGRWEVEIDGMDIPVQVKPQKIHKGQSNNSGDEEDDKLFRLGDTVTLKGLKIQSMNGKSGKINCFVADEGRWEVEIDRDWSVKVRPENIKLYEARENKKNDLCEGANKRNDSRSKKKKRKLRFFRKSKKSNE